MTNNIRFRFSKQQPCYLQDEQKTSRGIIAAALSFLFGGLTSKKGDSLPPTTVYNEEKKVQKTELHECIICLSTTFDNVCFKPKGCIHRICRLCTTTYFESVLEKDRIKSYEKIDCPEPKCKGKFVSNEILPVIYFNDELVVDHWWARALTKCHIKNKIICPFTECSAIFDIDPTLTKKCTFSECYECHKGFCVACQDRWHPGVIKIFDDQEELAKTLSRAQNQNWSRCPACFQIVEKTQGCLHIDCRCGESFCYRCGGKMYTHNVCSNNCHNFSGTKLATYRKNMFTAKKADTPATVAV